MQLTRYDNNPLVTVADVKPSRDDLRVVGVFNAGVVEHEDSVLMLIRVAERPVQDDEEHLLVPVLHGESGYVIDRISRSTPGLDFSDTRGVFLNRKMVSLSSISHLRVARSQDGKNFSVDPIPSVLPEGEWESWGIEDPRITRIGDTYNITYSAVSPNGVAVGLLTTKNFQTYERAGLIFPPTNKDVVIFPERIGGHYYALHRPAPTDIGDPNIWIAASPDLIHWGGHRFLAGVRPGQWDSSRIGAGTVPIRTDQGWLELYHGADQQSRYCVGALLLDLDNPSIVLARSETPLLEPEKSYEKQGFFGNVVFPCGSVVRDGIIHIYYGAADECIAGASVPVEVVLKSLAVPEGW